MTPLAAVPARPARPCYVGTVTAAFSALMRLSLRLTAERSGRDDLLGRYLDDPLRLFIPARLRPRRHLRRRRRAAGARDRRCRPAAACRSLIAAMARLRARLRASRAAGPSSAAIPRAVLDADCCRPSRPSRGCCGRSRSALLRIGRARRVGERRRATPRERRPNGRDADRRGSRRRHSSSDAGGQARALLRSIVDFRDTLVREVMTPRPDIVAIEVDATIDELRAARSASSSTRACRSSTTPSTTSSGFVVREGPDRHATRPTSRADHATLLRPAHFVPETKKVPSCSTSSSASASRAPSSSTSTAAPPAWSRSRICSRRSSARSATSTTSKSSRSSTRATACSCSAARPTSRARRAARTSTSSGEGFETVGGYLLAHARPRAGDGETLRRRRPRRSRCSKPSAGASPGARAPREPAPAEAESRAVVKIGFVALVGRPNAGKSTLLNRLVGRSSRSSPTSRRPPATGSSACARYPDGQIVFVDTPGHPQAAAPPERAHGGHRAATRCARSTSSSLVVDATRAGGRRRSLRDGARAPGEGAASCSRSTRSIWWRSRTLLPRDRSGTTRDRRVRRHRAGLGARPARTSSASKRCCCRTCPKASRSIPTTT